MTRETFAVALVGEEDHGWLVDAESAGEARRIVHGTVPRAHEVWESELLVWLASDYQARHLAGGPFSDAWTRLTPPAPCPVCTNGILVDPGGDDAYPRCMVETDAGPDGLILEGGCGYRPGAGGLALD